MLEGGCSKTATPPCVATALKSSLLLLWISLLCATRDASSGDKPGTPCMQVGVRKAFGPPGRSFSLLYSLHGGASVIRLTMPDHEMRISSSKHASSSMSCSELASRSKASKRERPCLSAAAAMGAWIPAKTSKRNPPLMWGSMRSSAVRAMLGGPSELPVLSLAAGRCVGADSEGWSASFAGDKACVAGGLAVRLGWVVPSATGCGIALSGGAAGAASGLFQVRLEGCCEAPCACWPPFMAHTCANWQLSVLQRPCWNLRQIGLP